MAHHHRSSTSLKQKNKSHKSNRSSKRSIKSTSGGKVQKGSKKTQNNGSSISMSMFSKAKANRLNMTKQRRIASKEKLLKQKRIQGRLNFKQESSTASSSSSSSTSIVPRVVGIISLSESQELENTVRSFLVDGSTKSTIGNDHVDNVDHIDHVHHIHNLTSSITAIYPKYKKEGYLTFLTNSTAFSSFYTTTLDKEDASVQAALDLCQVCDVVLFLMDGRDADADANTNTNAIKDNTNNNHILAGMEIGGAAGGAASSSSVTTSGITNQDYDHLISSRGQKILSAIKAQGLPTPITTLVNFEGDDANDANDDDLTLNSTLSMKSIRRSIIKKKLNLRKYLTRFAETEFGEYGSDKVIEIDIPYYLDNNDDDDNMMNIDKSILTIGKNGKSKKILPEHLINSNNNDICPSRSACIRSLCTMNASPPKWVTDMPRSYIISENNGLNGKGYVYDEKTKELRIYGYIRGQAPWNVNNLVHIPNVGTFAVKHIEYNEHTLQKKGKRNNDGMLLLEREEEEESEKEKVILAVSDCNKRESLEMFANPDALDGEQNLIGFDDDDGNSFNDDDDEEEDTSGNNGNNANFKKGVARPAGWSDYQSAWLGALGEDEDEEQNNGEQIDDDPFDHGELAFELNKKKDDATITDMDMDIEDANNLSAKERQILLQQRNKDKEDEMMFPDEVEVKEDENARDRFARYRSLKSFRKSYWDPKENLPDSYATIYHFSSFKATQGDVMADMKDVIEASNKEFYYVKSKTNEDNNDGDDDAMMEQDDNSYDDEDDILDGCVPSGKFVTLVIEGVSLSNSRKLSPNSLLTAVCLLPHENKISVLHINLSQTTQCDNYATDDLPVKSKDVLQFRCGWRKWNCRPVFAQNNLNCDKHKFERFMPTNGAFFSASVLGPVTYTPCPVLMFRKNDATNKIQLTALGSIFNADADRIIVKRIILSGYPTRVHKRNATVKYMFYNPDDVKV